MEHFETLALQSAKFKPATWLRYINDTFVIWIEGRDKLLDLIEHLNSIGSSIQLTTELEEDRKLPFTDVMVTRGEDRLLTSVHGKKTHTDRYIHFSPNHHDSVKQGVSRCLRSRVKRICVTEDVGEEHMKMTFQKKGYPKGFIACAMRQRLRLDETQYGETAAEEPTPGRKTSCVLLYARGTSDKAELAFMLHLPRSWKCIVACPIGPSIFSVNEKKRNGCCQDGEIQPLSSYHTHHDCPSFVVASGAWGGSWWPKPGECSVWVFVKRTVDVCAFNQDRISTRIPLTSASRDGDTCWNCSYTKDSYQAYIFKPEHVHEHWQLHVKHQNDWLVYMS